MPGYIIYKGPSKLDGQPIVVIAVTSSKNPKTGDMLQTYILNDNGLSPMENNRKGLDYSICGDCKHKGTPDPDKSSGVALSRSCYVSLHHGPNQVYKAYTRGGYTTSTTPSARALIGAGRHVRLGTYGDPLVVPSNVWRELCKDAPGSTGYTHASAILPGANLSKVMISADNIPDAVDAHQKGYRTFRVIPVRDWSIQGKSALLQNEILCPASKEAGYKTTCNDCLLCSGQGISAKSIAIPAHGIGKGYA